MAKATGSIVGLILLALAGVSVQAQQADADRDIVDGTSIGRISLGMPAEQALGILGKPRDTHPLRSGATTYSWVELRVRR